VIVELISATTTKTGLTVRCELDTGQYPKGIVVSDAEMAAINQTRRIPRRVELHNLTEYTPAKWRVYFVTKPKSAPHSGITAGTVTPSLRISDKGTA
jgi:hypothetical protein